MTMASSSLRCWCRVLVFVCALTALFLSLPPGPTPTVRAQSGERKLTLSMKAPARVRVARLNSPPVVPDKDKARLRASQAQMHRRGPATRVNTSAGTRAPASVPATAPRAAAAVDRPHVGQSVNAPETFTLFQNTDLKPGVGNNTSVVNEPSVGNIGSAVFETGNWFAAVSVDGGSSFGFLDPRGQDILPNSHGGFCCDQSVIYDPSRDLMLWTRMYARDATGNTVRLAVFHGEAALETSPILFDNYDFQPQDIGMPAGDWYDYPQIALGNNYLYFTANAFKSDLTFDGTVVLRLPLDGLASGLGFDYTGFVLGYFNLTPVQNAANTMYFATQNDSATLRVYQWPEGGDVTAFNVSHMYYPDPSILANYTCPLTGGIQDWCGRLDDRVLTGWLSGGVLGFMWNAPKGIGGFRTFAYPYVHVLFVNASSMTSAGEFPLYSDDCAFAYPAAAVNAAGHVAGTLFYGGGDIPPTVAAFIWDNYSPTPYPQIPATWELHSIPGAIGTQGPTEPLCTNCWGDYLAARRDYTSRYSRYLWIATGFTLQGGGNEEDIHPYFFRFGREWNDPVAVADRDRIQYFPIITKSE